METNHDYSGLLPLAEVAKRLPSRVPGKRINVQTVWRWVLSGRLPAVKIAGSYFVDPADLAALVEPVAVEKAPRKNSRAWERDAAEAEARVKAWLQTKGKRQAGSG